MLASARDKAIKFRLLILRDAAAGYLDKQQQDEIARDLQSAKEHFVDLVTADPEHFDLRLTDHVLLDGLANVMITLPGPNDQTEPDPTLLVVHDINVYPAEGKASLALVSPGRKHPGRRGPGLALGLSDRTVRMLEMSEPPPPSVGGTELQRLIRAHSDGLSARRNTPGQYIHLLPPYLEAVRKGSFGECPAPICVQLQITTRCSTRCVMCQHCSVENPHLFPRK